MKFNIDADVIAHKSSNICDGKYYSVLINGVEYKNKGKKIINKQCDLNKISRSEICTCFDPEPLSHCLGNMKRIISKIISHPQCTEYELFLSDNGNFRYDVYPEYKASRKTANNPNIRIPANLNGAKQYLRDHWNARILENYEADDYLSIKQCTEEDQCIVTTDKDLDGCPGYHFNWDRWSLYYVTEEEAYRSFYTQMITGDTTDDIPGLSEKAPNKRTFPTKPLEFLRTKEDMEAYVFEGYATKYWDEEALKMMTINGKLLWMCRDYEDVWEVSIF